MEDFIEKSHQEAKRARHRTARMAGGFISKELSQIRNCWKATHPDVEARAENVMDKTMQKQKATSVLSKGQATRVAVKRIKKEKYTAIKAILVKK